jgi:adenylate cyclase
VCPLIVAALDPAVADSERRALTRPMLAATGSPLAYHQLVLGYRNFYSGAYADATAEFRNAIREDATYAHAHAMLAVTIYLSAQVHRDHRWAGALELAEQSARRALEIDPSEPKGCNIMGQILDWQGRHDAAGAFLERAVSLNPSFALASTARSYHAVMTGAFAEAKAFIRTAMRLRVGDAGLGLCLPSKALADLHLGNREDALHTAHWAVRLQPRFWLGRQVLAVCLSANGDEAAAVRATQDLRRDYPGLTAEQFAAWFPYASAASAEPVKQALQRAGWD